MNEIILPTQSTSTLVKASIIASIVAAVVFITIILPAEYNIDPIGSGALMGLTVLSNDESDKVADENLAESGQPLAKRRTKDQTFEFQNSETTVTVPPQKGVEYKFKLEKHDKLTYEWTTDGQPLYFDFHGEPEGDVTGYFESYAIATSAESKGVVTVPFDGVHGWYWKNNSAQPVTVTLKTQGNYKVVGLIH